METDVSNCLFLLGGRVVGRERVGGRGDVIGQEEK